LHKLNSVSLFHHSFLSIRLLGFITLMLVLGATLLFIQVSASAQDQGRQPGGVKTTKGSQIKNEILPTTLGENWRALSPSRTLNPEEWAILPNADVYAEYGLQKLTSRIYSDGKSKGIVEVFEMRFESGSYGLLTFNRGTLPPYRQEFQIQRFLVSISGEDNKPVDPSLIDLLKKNFPVESGDRPFLLSHLPQRNKIAESEKYLIGPTALGHSKDFKHLKEVINFDGGVEVATADYQNGSGKMGLIIIEYHTPQAATKGFNDVRDHFESLDQNEKDRGLLKRIGNYIVKAVNIDDRKEAEEIIGQIKYNPKVYWSGRKLSDIPIDFRPPDPAVIEEATKTLRVLVRSFYWVGVMLAGSFLIGLIAGTTYFYWRRHRRRKLGIDDIFSDAGGSIRLNLDHFLLESKEPSIKQIGDGK
jgi:hypothetical protein